MEDKKLLEREELFSLLTCDPVTTRGTISLSNIQLSDEISKDYFFENLYVDAKVENNIIPTIPDEELQYLYMESEDEHDISRYMYKRFQSMLINSAPKSFPLLLLGASGNGKSIEILHQLWRMEKDIHNKYNYFYCNFEKAYSELTHGVRFRLKPEQVNDPLWLITMTILNTLYKLIEENEKNKSIIYSNHKKFFLANGAAENNEQVLFECIEQYNLADPTTHQKVFESLLKFIVTDVSESIENLIKMAMNILYCIDPQKKNIIVFDNLEYYIKVNLTDVPIHNSTLRSIYEITQRVSGSVEDIYNRISINESWRAFKIIIAIRRTSTRLIMRNSNTQFVSQMLKKGQDITNYFNIWDIWKKKIEYVWNPLLKEKYSTESNQIIDILNDMMNDVPGIYKTSYQERIAILMNTNIRRNASAQAYTAYTLFRLLSHKSSRLINYEAYKFMLKKTDSVVRYFYRNMLLELQYRRMMYSFESTNHFDNLRLNSHEKNCTLVRRILSFLSHFKDNHIYTDENGKTLRLNMYETLPLYKLMQQIFLSPCDIDKDNTSRRYDSKEIDNNLNIIGQGKTFSELAKVLLTLASMNNFTNKTAPFIILGINDNRFNEDSSEEELTIILKEIWDAGASMSQNNSTYDKLNYGVRLTNAGAMFLLDIQPSFPFFAALKEKESIPLFLLADKNKIKKIINDVYTLSNTLCERYENAAISFVGSDSSLRCNNHYFPCENCNTFRERVKYLHMNYLTLYYDFLDKTHKIIGISLNDTEEIKTYIEEYKNKYSQWNTSKECF